MNPTRYKNMLSFGNSKINAQAEMYGYRGGGASFDIPAGYTCPAADICKSYAVLGENGKMHIEQEENSKFLCYAAKIEALYKNAYKKHVENWEFTKKSEFVEVATQQIWNSGVTLLRIHSFGDFYDKKYFYKWLKIVESLTDVYFFAYTKQAILMVEYLKNPLPNMNMVYSMGGKLDNIALKYNLPSCYVVTNKGYKDAKYVPIEYVNINTAPHKLDESDAEHVNLLPIACRKDNKYDDLVYIRNQESFGIYVH